MFEPNREQMLQQAEMQQLKFNVIYVFVTSINFTLTFGKNGFIRKNIQCNVPTFFQENIYHLLTLDLVFVHMSKWILGPLRSEKALRNQTG